MNRRLFNLFVANAKKGSFKAEANTIYLYDVIVGSDEEAAWFGGVSPKSFAETLAGMTGTVNLRINSPGGDVFGSRAMAQAMRDYPGEIIAHVDGYAASAASLIAISANKCVMAPGALMMIHKAWTMSIGNADDLLSTAALLEKIDSTLADSYAAKSGGDAAKFAEMMAQETWFTPQEAKDAGLCDEIVSDTKEKPVSACGAWDVSAFERAPADKTEDRAAATAEKAAAEAELALAAIVAAEQSERRQRELTVRLLQTA